MQGWVIGLEGPLTVQEVPHVSTQHGEDSVVAVLTHELDEEAAHRKHDLLVGDPENLPQGDKGRRLLERR